MPEQRYLLPAAAIIMLTLSGCSTFTGGEMYKEGEPAGYIEVVNQSGQDLTHILVSRCDAMSYGTNRIPKGQKLKNGSSWFFTVGLDNKVRKDEKAAAARARGLSANTDIGCWHVMTGIWGGNHSNPYKHHVFAGDVVRHVVTNKSLSVTPQIRQLQMPLVPGSDEWREKRAACTMRATQDQVARGYCDNQLNFR